MKNIDLVIPVYNTPIPFMDECLESVLAQTYPHFCAMVIDDGSDVVYRNRLDEWQGRDSRIKIIHRENGGVSSARNVGLQLSTSEFVSFVDSDDVLHPDYLAELINYQSIANFEITICNHIKFGKRFKKETPFDWPQATYRAYENEDRVKLISHILTRSTCKELAGSSLAFPWGRLYRRSLVENILYPEHLPWGEDLLFNLYAFEAASKIGIVNSALYYYRYSSDSSTNAYRHNAPERILDFLHEARHFVDTYHPVQLRNAYYMRVMSMFTHAMQQSMCNKKMPILQGIRKCREFAKNPVVQEAFQKIRPQAFTASKPAKIFIYLGQHKMFGLLCIMHRARRIYRGRKML